MKGKARRLLSWVCVLALCMSLLPVTALATTGSGTQKDPVTNTENQVTVNKWVTGTGTENDPYRLNMEAYASDTITSTTTTTPLDIVLVLDTSGSMADSFGEDEGYRYTEVEKTEWSYNDIRNAGNDYFVEVDGRYYEVVAEADGSWEYDGGDWEWKESNFQIGYYTGRRSNREFHELGKSLDNPDKILWADTLYTREYHNADTKLQAMKSAVNEFIDTVAGKSQNTDHRIGIISFASNAQTEQSLTSVSSGSEILKNSVNELSANGGTQSDDGLSAAKNMLDGETRASKKVVILFTDGEPGNYGFTGSVAAAAVNTAKELKDNHVTVYTIGVFEDANPSDINGRFNEYMNAVSSNYPTATAQGHSGGYTWDDWDSRKLGSKAEGDYYFAATDSDSLTNVFEGIAEDVTTSTLEVYPDEEAILSDTLSEYFDFPADMQTSGNGRDVTVSYVKAESVNDRTITWEKDPSELPDGSDIEVEVADGTITITGFDYYANAVTKNVVNGETTYSGGKLVVSFPIELDAAACLANPVADGLYPTNNTTDSEAGLAYKSSDEVTTNDEATRLDQSPTVKVDNEDISANGTDVTVQVYVDGSPVTDPYNYVDLKRNTKDTTYNYWNDKLDTATGIISCDFNYNPNDGHNCVDIDVALKNNGYILQGVEWFQNAGSGNAHDINQNESPYTIDNVAADPEGNVDVKIYLNTVYSVQYYLNGVVYSENGYTDSTTYIANEGISEADYTELTGEIQNATQSWKNSGYSTSINVKSLPAVENSTVNGWWQNDSNYEGDVDYNENATAQVKDTVPQDDTKVIKFYAKSTLNTGAVVINYRNEDGGSIKNSETRTDTVGKTYNFDVSSDTNGDIPFVINHANDDGTTTKYVFDHFTEDSVGLTGTYTNGQQEITAVYKVDSDGDEQDIPDEYIATVTYKVVNGTWTDTNTNVDRTEAFVLKTFDADSNTWVDANPTLGDTIPTAQADEDYLESSGAWYTGSPENKVEITGSTEVKDNITYTYRYTTEKAPALYVDKTVVSVGDVEVSNQSAIPVAKVGDMILYKIEVKNTGNVLLDDISIQDFLNSAAQTLYIDEACATELSGYVSLDTNATGTYYVKYVVTAKNAGSNLINIAKAASGDVTCEDTVAVTVAQQYTLTVNYYYDSINEDNKFEPEGSPLTYTLNANDPWSVEIGGSNGTHNAPTEVFKDGTHYTFDRVASTSTLSGEITDDVVVNLVYSKDVIGGGEDLDTPDQIPDKYQVTIEYKADEGGSIAENALTKEVKTIYADDSETYAESGTVTATGSTATANEGYFFNKWTKAVNGGNAEDTDLLAETGSINLNTVTGGDVITFTAYFTEENPEVNITKELTSVTRDGQKIEDLTAYTAQVGDQLIYTITVTNIGNMTLETVTVEDVFTGSGTLTFSDAENVKVEGTTLTISDLSNEEGRNSVSIKATYTVQPGDISKDTIVNTANAYIGEEGGDPDDTAEETVRMDDYTVTITPANITIYTGGDGYSGVTDGDGNVIPGTETSGLPEPGYFITLPASVRSWLESKDVGSTGQDLSGKLKFTYNVPGSYGEQVTREWILTYVGVHDNDSNVYSMAPTTNTPAVRLAFKDPVTGEAIKSDKILEMSENSVCGTYNMTIDPGELDQSEVKAVLTVDDDSITCQTKVDTGTLTIRSVVNQENNTNSIATDSSTVDADTITAVADENVTYYVNDSEVKVENENDRVQLLVDEVSNNIDFNAAMGNDAVAKVNAALGELGEGNTLSNAAYDLAYMDLVDTQNGNTVVTMGDNQSLFIYWPVPDDAAEDSEFHVVHYYELDREEVTNADDLGEATTQKVDTKEVNGQSYVVFETSSFSPFALVYEKAPDPVASLDVTKTLTAVNGKTPGSSVSVGDTLTYTITVKNGEVALKDVTITDTFTGKGDLNFRLPDGATVSENQDGTYTITLGNLTAGQEVTITATYKVLRADASSNLVNTAKVTGTNPDDPDTPVTDEVQTPETPVNPYRPPIRPPEDPDKPELNTEDHYAYIVGYEDGSVQPEGDITRAEVATIFFRLLTDESRNEYWSQTNPYSDVSADDWFNNAVSTLTNAGVLDGYEDGTFKPNGNITRAEFATITARFFEATYDGENLFPDIEGHWAQDYINEAANAGIVNGYEDGTFRPQQYITRAEAVTMVNRTIERHPDADHLLDDMITWPDNPETAWYYEQIQEATNSHEYTMNTDDEQNPYEIWTKLLPNRDWSELEKEWSDANDGAGSGEVV